MAHRFDESAKLRDSVERHYDSLAFLYRTFWGEHIHHGLWTAADDSPRIAQVRLVEHLAELARVARGSRILDVGCGYGASGRWLAANLDCRVTGITISSAQARRAIRLNRRLAARPQVVRGDAAALPFAADMFDVVWVIECIEHLVDKRGFVRAIGRLLKPGGRFALCGWERDRNASSDDRLVRDVCDAFICPALSSTEEHQSWCADAGLEVLVVENLTCRVRPTWDVLIGRVENPWLAPLRWLVGREIRRFAAGFSTIAEAYDSGAMRYGLLVAARP